MRNAKTLNEGLSDLLLSELHLDVNPDTDLLDIGLLDSAMIVEILLLLETRGIEISMEDLEIDNLRTIRSIANLIEAETSSV